MLGSKYAANPEVILGSFRNWEEGATKKLEIKNFLDAILVNLIKRYIKIFGIPHIGSQLRFLHFQKMLKIILQFSPKVILDTGCGIGFYSFWLSQKYSYSKIIGCDIDRSKISFCKTFSKQLKINNVDFLYEDIEKIKNKNKYDLVINIDVLEHVKNHKLVLKNFYNLLLPGGFLYIHVPCPNQKLIFKEFSQYHYTGHVVDGFTLNYLQKEMKKIGFKIIQTQKTFGFFGTLAWEINHWTLANNLFIAGCLFPFLYTLSKLDLYLKNENGCGIAVLAQKVKEK